MMTFFLRAIIGGILVAAIPEIAKRTSPKLAGIILLVPIISILALYFTAQEIGTPGAGQLARGALIGLLPLSLFFITVHFASQRLSLIPMITSAFVIWLLSASLFAFNSK